MTGDDWYRLICWGGLSVGLAVLLGAVIKGPGDSSKEHKKTQDKRDSEGGRQ